MSHQFTFGLPFYILIYFLKLCFEAHDLLRPPVKHFQTVDKNWNPVNEHITLELTLVQIQRYIFSVGWGDGDVGGRRAGW